MIAAVDGYVWLDANHERLGLGAHVHDALEHGLHRIPTLLGTFVAGSRRIPHTD